MSLNVRSIKKHLFQASCYCTFPKYSRGNFFTNKCSPVRLIFKNERIIKNRQAIATLQAKPLDVSEASCDRGVEYAREIWRRKSAAVTTVSSTEPKKGEFSDQRTESILPEEPINRGGRRRFFRAFALASAKAK